MARPRAPANDYISSTALAVGMGRYASPNGAAQYAGLRVLSAATSAVPFMAGTVAAKGVFPSGVTVGTDTTGVHAIVKRRWNDGSAKHIILAGTLNTAGTYKDVRLNSSGVAGTPLTSAAITAANPQAFVMLYGVGGVDLADLLGAPVRTWVATPNMVECHYLGKIGTDWYVWFHVKHWSAGHTHVRVVVEYSTLPYTNSNVQYEVEVFIGGQVVFNNNTNLYVHAKNTRWTVEGWAQGGATVEIKHDSATLMGSKLTPKYFGVPSDANLNALTQTYTPGAVANIRANYEGGGYHEQIGLLPQWDADYITSTDEHARKAVIASSLSMGSHATIWRDPNTNLPVRPTDRPTWAFGGDNGGGHSNIAAANQSGGYYSWDIAHHASPGYLAYLITGDYVHLENLQMHGASIFLGAGNYQWTGPATATGTGINRVLEGQTRAVAWSVRTLGQLAGIAPDDDMSSAGVGGDYSLWLNNLAGWYKANGQDLAPDSLGYPLTIGTYNPSAPLTSAPWMHNFWIQSMGHASDLEPISNMTTFNALRDWMYRGVVGMLGDGSAGTYDYRYAGMYNITSSASVIGNYAMTYASTLYSNWGQVWAAMLTNLNAQTETYGYKQPQNAVAGTLYGTYGSVDYGYLGNMLPAIAYACSHQAVGADDAYLRLLNATNYSVVTTQVSGQRSWAVESRRTPVASGVWSTDNVPGSYNAGTYAWTPGRGSDGRVTQASWDLVPQDVLVEVIGTRMDALQSVVVAAIPGWQDKGISSWDGLITAWSGYALDSAAPRAFVFGGGHHDSSNNGLYRVDFDKMAWGIEILPTDSTLFDSGYNTGAVTSLTGYPPAATYASANPSQASVYSDCFYPFAPNQPTARHSYSSLAYDPARNLLFMGCRRMWVADLATGTWSARMPFGTNVGSYTGLTGYTGENIFGFIDEVTGGYIAMSTQNGDQSKAWEYNHTAQTFDDRAGLPGSDSSIYGAACKVGRYVWVFVRSDVNAAGRLIKCNLDTQTVESTTMLTGTGVADTYANYYDGGGMTWVPERSKFFVVTRSVALANLRAYWIDAAAGTMEPATELGAWAFDPDNLGFENKAQYVPQLKAIALIYKATQNIKLIKVA